MGHSALDRFGKQADATASNADRVLFPDGWHEPLKSIKVIADIREAIRYAAIEQSLVPRGYNIRYEVTAKPLILPGVSLWGKLDVVWPGGFLDYKFVKDPFAKYLTTERSLPNDPKMMSYVWAYFQANPYDQYVTMEMLYISKIRPSQHRSVKVTVSKEQCQLWEHQVLHPLTKELIYNRTHFTAKDWKRVTGPNESGACQKYGGCEFLHLCTNRKPLEAFLRTDKPKQSPAPRTRTLPTMNDLLVHVKNAPHLQPEAPSNPAPTLPILPVERDPQEGGYKTLPAPWAVRNCVACSGTGVSSSLKVCLPCQNTSQDLPKSMWYSIYEYQNKGLMWTIRPEYRDRIIDPQVKGISIVNQPPQESNFNPLQVPPPQQQSFEATPAQWPQYVPNPGAEPNPPNVTMPPTPTPAPQPQQFQQQPPAIAQQQEVNQAFQQQAPPTTQAPQTTEINTKDAQPSTQTLKFKGFVVVFGTATKGFGTKTLLFANIARQIQGLPQQHADHVQRRQHYAALLSQVLQQLEGYAIIISPNDENEESKQMIQVLEAYACAIIRGHN